LPGEGVFKVVTVLQIRKIGATAFSRFSTFSVPWHLGG
jgi:hypothetical protein